MSSSSSTLTRLGKRVERSTGPHSGRPAVGGYRHPRLRAIAWHRAWLRALASLDDKEAQDAAGDFHMKRLAQYLREEREGCP